MTERKPRRLLNGPRRQRMLKREGVAAPAEEDHQWKLPEPPQAPCKAGKETATDAKFDEGGHGGLLAPYPTKAGQGGSGGGLRGGGEEGLASQRWAPICWRGSSRIAHAGPLELGPTTPHG